MESQLASDRTLRSICLMACIPASFLLIYYGMIYHKIFPVIGLVPMLISSLFACFMLRKNLGPRWSTNAGSKVGWLQVFFDVFLAASLLSTLVPWWLGEAKMARALLGAYATMPLLLNLCIHVYFAIRRWIPEVSFSKPCPHCHSDSQMGIPRKSMQVRFGGSSEPRGSRDSYQPVETETEEYDDARESSEFDALFRPSEETVRGSTEGSKLISAV